MTKQERIEARLRSTARSMEAEGANYERVLKIMQDKLKEIQEQQAKKAD